MKLYTAISSHPKNHNHVAKHPAHKNPNRKKLSGSLSLSHSVHSNKWNVQGQPKHFGGLRQNLQIGSLCYHLNNI